MPITELSPAVLEALAQAIHARYRANQARRKPAHDPAMADWRALPHHLRRSNRAQAADIIPKLRATGYAVHEASDSEAAAIVFSTAEIERMAVMEHERWTAERRGDTWSPGERDVPERRTSDLVSWAELSEEKREWDREAVRAIPELLSGVGLEIRRAREPADGPPQCPAGGRRRARSALTRDPGPGDRPREADEAVSRQP